MTAARLNKLKYRAWHRGFREADLILGPFADTHVHGLNGAQLDAFELLLEQPDQDLYAWIVGQAETPAAFDTEVMDLIRRFRFSAKAARGDALGA
ncbi:MAG: succinate dehydrogenase assembly factor 2 [Caulobacteraceae bacterium]